MALQRKGSHREVEPGSAELGRGEFKHGAEGESARGPVYEEEADRYGGEEVIACVG